jgi:hypothetical protein
MKKNHRLIAAATLVGGMLTIYACGGPKQITAVTNEKEVDIPCSEKSTDKEYFRGFGIGQSKDLNTARDKARMAANAELAGNISTLIKSVAERYVNDAGQSPADYSETFDAMTKSVVQQQVSNLMVGCNKTMHTKDGMYKVYLTMEAHKDAVFATLERAAANDKKLETIFNREKFRKNFDEEMASFSKSYENN